MAGFFDKLSWVNKAVQYPQRFFMNWDGGNDKNLLPPFSDWTLHANATSTAPYTLSLNATASGQGSNVKVPCIPSTQYTFSTPTLTNIYYDLTVFDVSGAVVQTNFTKRDTFTFTTPSTGVSITVTAQSNATTGLYTFTNPQLELGSSATSFTPKKMYTIVQSGGTVTAAGTAVNATNLNRLEQAVQDTLILNIMGAL